MELSPGQKLLIVIGLGAILLALVILSLNHARQAREQSSVEVVAPAWPAVPPQVTVHVVGAVNRPGVYALPQGARVRDAVALAGNFRSDADTASVNLAARVQDGQQISVGLAGAGPQVAPPPSPPPSAAGAEVAPVAGRAPTPHPAATSAPLDAVPHKPISLSSATLAELASLPGVGETLALKVVYYRNQHGPFRNVNDLLKVPGFGEHRLETVRPYVVP